MSDSKPPPGELDEAILRQGIRELAPWHHDIQLTEQLSTGQVFSEAGEVAQSHPLDIGIRNPRDYFLGVVDAVYPSGLKGKRLLDCACNAGCFGFFAAERGVHEVVGFDVREHWIRQAQFVKKHRRVAPTENLSFLVGDLMDLERLDLDPFQITIFRGIFYHLPEPVRGLQIAAGLTQELIWFQTAAAWGEPDGSLRLKIEDRDHLMSGVHGLSWHPTGPRVIAQILRWLGFVDVRLLSHRQNPLSPKIGRIDILASRIDGLLDPIDAERLV